MSATSSLPHHYWPPYTPMPMDDRRPRIVRGDGVFLYEETGRRYIDGISGSYNHCLGHSNPALTAAVKQQLDTLVHACNIGSNTGLPETLADKIRDRLTQTGLTHTFLVTGGSEGVEAALKMAWQYQSSRGRPQRTQVVAIDDAYHGCTLGAMIATQRAFINDGALPLLGAYSMSMPAPASLDDLPKWQALLAEHESAIAAIIVEPVMAMAGTRQFPDGFLRALSALAKRYDIPLICDEVYCGIGRAGAFCEAVAQGADRISLSSASASAAVFRSPQWWRRRPWSTALPSIPYRSRHGHTQDPEISGCPRHCFIFDLFTHHCYEAVTLKGARLLQRIRENLPTEDVRHQRTGKGTDAVDHLESPRACDRAQLAARRHGVLVGAADRHLKLAPAFTIDDTEASELAERLVGAIRGAAQG